MQFLRLIWIFLICSLQFLVTAQTTDWRLISNGQRIYEHGYCDQPYIVATSDGIWVCTFTTAPGKEGDEMQYIASCYSNDQGQTWSDPVPIEGAFSAREASWAMPLVTSFDRIYVFYTFNGDGIRQLPDGTGMRADTHGWYCFRYSDDHGRSWSSRQRLNLRKTTCDYQNDFGGEVQMFWGIGKPISKGEDVWFSFTKLGKYFLEEGEGWVFHSKNILFEKNVSKLKWQLLPDGDTGIKSPMLGSVQEELNIQPLNMEGGLYGVYRTAMGQPAESYSYDSGRTWSVPQTMTYASGKPIRNPRACTRVWKCKNGKYLLWFHNNGGTSFSHRNPAWVSGGQELAGKIYWSQPEILLYGPNRSYETGRFSYPDLVEEDDRYWISTTQKTTATVHEVPPKFFDQLWGQFQETDTVTSGFAVNLDFTPEKTIPLPQVLKANREGFAMDFWLKLDTFDDQILFESVDGKNLRVSLHLLKKGNLDFVLSGRGEHIVLPSDFGRIGVGHWHHIAILIDARAKITYMLIDGSICDGGGKDLFGFRWFDQVLREGEIKQIRVRDFPGQMKRFRFYSRQMFTSDFVANYRAEIEQMTRRN